MSYILNNIEYATDEHGYLIDHTQWSEALAEHIAQVEGIELSPAHWQVIHFVRNFHAQYDTTPAIRALVKALKEQFGEEVGNSRHLQRLLPQGPAKMASKLAGLKKPAKCL